MKMETTTMEAKMRKLEIVFINNTSLLLESEMRLPLFNNPPLAQDINIIVSIIIIIIIIAFSLQMLVEI